MRGFFYPRSAAVLGVSPRFTNLGRAIATNLIHQGFDGRLFFVGPSGGHLFGHRIYETIEALPEPVEAAVILTPAATVPELIEACGRKGVRRVIIESGGFGEFDSGRLDLEKELLAAAEAHGIRFIGPNCIGVANLENGFVVPFARFPDSVRRGEIGIISQSGGVGLAYVNRLVSERLGVSKFISVGNKLNVDENDLLEYLIEDDRTGLICLYLESIADGRRLMDLAGRTDKPILIHKANTSAVSARIAASHTAALSGDDAVVEAAFRQAGIVRVRGVQEMINYLKVLTQPRLKGRRLGVVSRSGGEAVIAADACQAFGLEMPAFPRQFLDEFEKHFRGGVIKIQNPIDLGDLFDFTVYTDIAEGVLSRPEVDGLLFAHGYRGAETPRSREFLAAVAGIVQRLGKPAALCLLVEESEMTYVKQEFDFPVFAGPEEAAAALSVSHQLHLKSQWPKRSNPLKSDLDEARIDRLLSDGKPGLAQCLELARAAGIRVVPFREVFSPEEALAAAEELGYPVALKAGRAEVSHKSDVGGVALGLDSPEALAAGLEKISASLGAAGLERPWPLVVQAMVEAGQEMILGGRQDRVFGPVVLVGLGGIFVEILGDVSLGVAPLDERQAGLMLGQLRGGKILDGVRGGPATDREALIETLLRLAGLMDRFRRIGEIDLNPVKVLPAGQGVVALDARVVPVQGR